MLRKFRIKIDGKEYLVEMEEIGGSPRPLENPAPTQVNEPTQPTSAQEQKEEMPQAETAPAPIANPEELEGEPVLAPMPGTVLKLLVKPGQTVKENQPLLVLEAMKMENEIVAVQDGTVAGIYVNEGQMVDVSAPLITIK